MTVGHSLEKENVRVQVQDIVPIRVQVRPHLRHMKRWEAMGLASRHREGQHKIACSVSYYIMWFVVSKRIHSSIRRSISSMAVDLELVLLFTVERFSRTGEEKM